ncbi:MAG: right-handed parallel beta-helix repeat-containing protein [Deltaproteobacteria bacterium]|nr:right-handed parallel beta-helix repeat-containing protein [Deltaproteobacteria bacterium]
MPKVLSLFILLTSLLVGEAIAADLLVPESYKTIQEAIEAAGPGDTVLVNEGVYTENLSIRKPLKLKAVKGPELTVIRAAVKEEPAILVSGTEGVVISGFAAKGSLSSGITLKNVTNSEVSGNVADENVYGIALYDSSENSVTGNAADRNEYYGIYLEKSHHNTIEGNNANRNYDKGLFISYSNSNVIRENTANLNTWNGLTLWSSNDNVIVDNTTLRNMYGIVVSDSKDNEISGNTTLPNVFLILPVVLIYLGIVTYLIQKNVLKLAYGVR